MKFKVRRDDAGKIHYYLDGAHITPPGILGEISLRPSGTSGITIRRQTNGRAHTIEVTIAVEEWEAEVTIPDAAAGYVTGIVDANPRD